MKREAYDALADVPGAVLKPRAKRDKSEGRQAPGSTLTTYAKLNPVNKERAAQARAEDFGVQAQACYRLPCFRCARQGASVPHHEPPRARGGTDRDSLPLCDRTRLSGVNGCHQLRHDQGEVTFWKELGCTPDEAKDHVRLQANLLPPIP